MSIRTQAGRRLLDASFFTAVLIAGVCLCVNMMADKVRSTLPAPRTVAWNHLSATAGVAFVITMCAVVILAAAGEVARRPSRRQRPAQYR